MRGTKDDILHAVVLFHDHVAGFIASPEISQQFTAAAGMIRNRYPDSLVYDFLPIAIVPIDSTSEIDWLATLPGMVNAYIAPQSVNEQPEFYDRMLSALSAVRSQSVYQDLQWYAARGNGSEFPNEDWEGGIWPPGPYPTLDRETGVVTVRDEDVTMWAEPAKISVINISIEPPRSIRVEPHDPISFMLAMMASAHCIVIAAGNSGLDPGTMNPWALVDGVVSVGAMESETVLWASSSRELRESGKRGPDVVADGTLPAFGEIGTSYAAPRVAFLATLCGSLVAELVSAVNEARGVNIGVPVQALAIIDLVGFDVALHQEAIPRFVQLPALPHAGLFRDAVIRSARLLGPELVEGLINTRLGPWRFVSPQVMGKWIRDSAQPVADCSAEEVGAGLVTLWGLLGHLERLSIADVFLHVFRVQPRTWHEELDEPAFDPVGLKQLAALLRMTRPLYVRDTLKGEFVRGPKMQTDTIALSQFDYSSLLFEVPLGASHITKVVRANAEWPAGELPWL